MNTNPTPSQEGPSAGDLDLTHRIGNIAYQLVSMNRSDRDRAISEMVADNRIAHTAAAVEQARKELDAIKVENTRAHGTICRLERAEQTAWNAMNLAIEQRDKAQSERDALTRQLAEREKELAEVKETHETTRQRFLLAQRHHEAAEAQLADLQRSNGELREAIEEYVSLDRA